MSYLNRRKFLKTSAGILSASAMGTVNMSCRQQQAGKSSSTFKYAMCNESMRDKSWARQCRIISNAGYTGVEIAAFTFVERGVQELTARDRKQMVSIMNDNGLECVGLHWLLAPPPEGLHFTTPDEKIRTRTVAYLDELIDFCGDLGGTVMIFGSPKQRNTMGISRGQANKYFADGLAAVADHAADRSVMILLETLDKSQTDVVNTTAEAMTIIRQINHPAIQTMFDFHNTKDETEDFVTLLRKYKDYIHHVHVMEMDGRHLGTGNAVNEYVDAFQYLRDIKYDKWVSLEVFDFTPGGEIIANESMEVLKKIESKLV